MFELEIMATGYTVLVAATSTCICKCFGRKKLNKLVDELSVIRSDLLKAEAEIKNIKMASITRSEHNIKDKSS